MRYFELSEFMIESMANDIFKVVHISDRHITLRIYLNNRYYVDLHRYRSTQEDNGYDSYQYQLNVELPLENAKLISEVWVDENIDHRKFWKIKTRLL